MMTTAFLTSAFIAMLQSGDDVAARIDTIATLNGTCQSLIVADDNHNDVCGSQLANVAYRNGESNFMVDIGNGNRVSFFGQDSAAVDGAAVITLSRVTVALGREMNSYVARGQCRYTNPYAGVSTVVCNATADGHRYHLTFRSDGRPPNIQRVNP